MLLAVRVRVVVNIWSLSADIGIPFSPGKEGLPVVSTT